MLDQKKKIGRWIFIGGLLTIFLEIAEILIAKSIFNNNPKVWKQYATIMILITMLIFLIISVIKFLKYQRYAKNYKQKIIEKVSKELSTEFKQVSLNYSRPISKDLFKCQAMIDSDKKIVCKIQLDYEVKFGNYEEFLNYFHLSHN